MPSSTSNSSARAPGGPWLQTWLTTLALTLAIVGGLECGWRQLGHRPSVVDDQNWWAMARERAANKRRDTIVLLGTSRMQLGLSSEVVHARFPDAELVRLGIEGKHCAAALRDLADDPAFCGVVIASIKPEALSLRYRDGQADYVGTYRRGVSLYTRLNRSISAWLQARLVAIHPNVRLGDVMTGLVFDGELPAPLYLITDCDRGRRADYRLANIPGLLAFHHEFLAEQRAKHAPPEPNRWLAEARELEPSIQQIVDRGGRVVFVRFPTAGEIAAWDDEYYPRRDFWDRFAALTVADTIHCADVPALTGFALPDTSHLDERDAPAFTGGLLDELTRRGVLDADGRALAKVASPSAPRSVRR